MAQKGQKAKYSLRADVFRFAPESGLKSDITPCPVRATSGLLHRNKARTQPITLSARASTIGSVEPCYSIRMRGASFG
jgi:hypothetical protein